MASSLRSDTVGGAFPARQGMYDPSFEKDACGLAMVATLRGEAGHDIIDLALTALRNLEHRGAIGSDAGTGDGAGILTQMPDAFLRAVVDFDLPPVGEYAAGMVFLPLGHDERTAMKAGIEEIARHENLEVLGWREVPVETENLGKLAYEARPAFEQLFVSRPAVGDQPALSGTALDRRVYRLRKRARHELGDGDFGGDRAGRAAGVRCELVENLPASVHLRANQARVLLQGSFAFLCGEASLELAGGHGDGAER